MLESNICLCKVFIVKKYIEDGDDGDDSKDPFCVPPSGSFCVHRRPREIKMLFG